jgi:hypothetical protein
MNMKTSARTNSLNLSPVRLALLLIPFVLTCFAFSPPARAVCQEGCETNSNTFLGEDALLNLTTGVDNTAIGFNALYSNTINNYNTAIGAQALYSNRGGSDAGNSNTAIGYLALYSNTGNDNTAIGREALTRNTTGHFNTATGKWALVGNTTGDFNTATGGQALYSNTTGSYNTANGDQSLLVNSTGGYNTAVGYYALLGNTTGTNNIGIGALAGYNLTTGSGNIVIGTLGRPEDSNKIRIGSSQTKTFIAGIRGANVPGGVGVIIDTNGQLGTTMSSARYKDNIKPMDKASEAILALKPVTFRYKHELDANGIPQFGLVAEEVEKVNPDLVARDEQGKPYTVRYEAVNAMLLNELLKAHRRLEDQEHKIALQERNGKEQEAMMTEQQKEIQALAASLKEQSAQIQQVNNQLQARQSAPRLVSKDN